MFFSIDDELLQLTGIFSFLFIFLIIIAVLGVN